MCRGLIIRVSFRGPGIHTHDTNTTGYDEPFTYCHLNKISNSGNVHGLPPKSVFLRNVCVSPKTLHMISEVARQSLEPASESLFYPLRPLYIPGVSVKIIS
jgi:hypothetical protein